MPAFPGVQLRLRGRLRRGLLPQLRLRFSSSLSLVRAQGGGSEGGGGGGGGGEGEALNFDLDDGDRDAWLAAAREPAALGGLAAGLAAAARAGAGCAAEDAALEAACTVLTGVMARRPATGLRAALPPAVGMPRASAGAATAGLVEWVAARLQASSAPPPADATTAAVAHTLAAILRADADAAAAAGPGGSGGGDGDDAMVDGAADGGLPAADAEAALVTALQRGWAAAALRAARAGQASRQGQGDGGGGDSGGADDDLAGLAAAAGAALVAWSRALVAGADAVEVRPTLAAAAAAAPWVRELLSRPPLPPAEGGAALRLFLGTLRRVGAVPDGLDE